MSPRSRIEDMPIVLTQSEKLRFNKEKEHEIDTKLRFHKEKKHEIDTVTYL